MAMVFYASFYNISVISWWSVGLVEETGVPGENQPTCGKSVTNPIQGLMDNTVIKQ
jgi:hypothetical protein